MRSYRLGHLAWVGLVGGIAAAEIIAAGILIETNSKARDYQDRFGIVSLCKGLLGVSEPSFYFELRAANERMHQAMDVASSGDPDRDFTQMMMAHHQGAIDMALVQLKFGHDEYVRRLAQSIIVEQNQEIA